MKIMSARLGEMDIDPATILTINDGVIGFPVYKRYVSLPFMEGTPFELFQAIDNGNLAFVTLDPFLFCSDYEFAIDNAQLENIQVSDKNDLIVKVIVTIPTDHKKMTANLQGPILINEARLLAKQIILIDSKYGTKERVFPDQG